MAWWGDEDQVDVTKADPPMPATEKQVNFLRRHWDQIRGLVSSKEYKQGADEFFGQISKKRASWLIGELIRSIDEGIPLPKRPHVKPVSIRVPRNCGTCIADRRNTGGKCGCEWPKFYPEKGAQCPGYRRDPKVIPPTLEGFDMLRDKRCLARWPDGSYAVVVPIDILPGEGILVRLGEEIYEIEFGSGPELTLLED